MTKQGTVYPVKNVYKNIRGYGKVKILTKDKAYDCLVGKNSRIKVKIVIDDLGNAFQINKSNLFYTKINRRDNIINQLLQ
jgi:hypothetical protein